MTNAVNESNPEVGSSSMRQSGSLTNSTPIDALFLSPPEIPFNNSLPIYNNKSKLYKSMLTLL